MKTYILVWHESKYSILKCDDMINKICGRGIANEGVTFYLIKRTSFMYQVEDNAIRPSTHKMLI